MSNLKLYMNDLLKFRFLLSELVKRDLVVKYKRSVLGIFWSVLQPLFIMAVMVIIFSKLFDGSSIKYYPIFVLSGKILWDLFSQTTTFGMGSILGGSSLLKKVYIPKYIFPLSKSVSALVNTMLSMIGMVVLMIIMGVPFHLNFVMIIFPFFYLFLFSVGISFILSTYVVFFRDINYLFEVVLTAWMYFSAIFYPPDILGDKAYLLQFNPVYRQIEMFRDIIIYNKMPGIEDHLIGLGIGIVFVIIGLIVLKRNQDKFILYF